MADADRNFKISIIVDGVDQATAGAKKVQSGFDGIEKTIGTTSGSGLVKDLTTLAQKQDAQAASATKATEALKAETAALKDNAAAHQQAASAGGGGGLSQDGKDAVARVMADFEKRAAPVKKGLADLKEEAAKLDPEVGKLDKSFLNLVAPGKAQGLSNMVKAFGEMAGPIAAIVATAKIAHGQVSDLLDQFKDADPESYKAFTDANKGLMAIIHPLEAGKGLVKGFFNALSGGAFDSIKDLKAAKERVDDTTKSLAELTKERKAENAAFVDKTILDRLTAENRAIEDQSQAYERLKKVKGAQDSAAESAAKLADKRALAGGADPFDVGSGAINRQVQQQVTALEQEKQDALQKVSEAKQRERALEIELAAAIKGGTKSQKELDGISAKIATAANSTQDAEDDLKAIQEAAESKRQEIVNGGVSAMEDLGAKVANDLQGKTGPVSEQVTKDAEAVLDLVKTKVEETGVKLTEGTKNNLKRLEDLLKDGTPDGNQTDQIANLILGIRGDYNLRDDKTFKALNLLRDDVVEKGQQMDVIIRAFQVQNAKTQANSERIEQIARAAGIQGATNSSPRPAN